MCDLCSSDPKEKQAAREGTLIMAVRLERMAQILRDLTAGRQRSHDPNGCGSLTARGLIRYLVEEWM